MGLVTGIRNLEERARAGLGSGSSALLSLENGGKKTSTPFYPNTTVPTFNAAI